MRNIKNIIKTALYLSFQLLISTGIAGVSTEKIVISHDLVSKSLQKITVPESNQNITVSVLLERYAGTQDKFQSSFIIKSRSTAVGSTNHPLNKTPDKTEFRMYEDEFCYDGRRQSLKASQWLNLDSIPAKNPSIEDKTYNYLRLLWDGTTSYSYAWDNYSESNKLGTVILDRSDKYKPSGMDFMPRGAEFGRFSGDVKRIDEVIRQCSQVSLRKEMEKVNQTDCYVIDAIVKGGKYTIWIDPEHSYNISKALIHKEKGSQAWGRELDNEMKIESKFEVLKFEKIDDIWVPMEENLDGILEWSGGHYSKGTTHVERTSVILNPDHDALSSFALDDIKNGARCLMQGLKVDYLWQDGKLVDSYSHEVDLDHLGAPSLVGKALPDLAQFNAKLDSEAIKNKMLLVCFWDMEQRPSRNAILTLNKSAQTLLDKNNVYMTFIHAGPVEEQKFISWLKQNEIQPPAGVSRTGLPELGYTWGIQSLPCLILTDKKHIVAAEGFSITELDEKIKIFNK